MPAEACIEPSSRAWIPACAGMTRRPAAPRSQSTLPLAFPAAQLGLACGHSRHPSERRRKRAGPRLAPTRFDWTRMPCCQREEAEAMSHVSLRPEFEELVELDAPAIQVASDCVFTEGPVWHPVDHFLLFSDMPGDVRRRWDPQGGAVEVKRPSN